MSEVLTLLNGTFGISFLFLFQTQADLENLERRMAKDISSYPDLKCNEKLMMENLLNGENMKIIYMARKLILFEMLCDQAKCVFWI